ncbi:MAG: amidase family protein, partial [Hyphomicrobiaceae bacterium]
VTIPLIDDIPNQYVNGGLAGAEAWAAHRKRLATRAADYDPRVGTRIQVAAKQTAADYIDTLRARQRIIAEIHQSTRDFDALLMPAVPIIPPKITEVAGEADYVSLNGLVLRNTAVSNFLDRCSISLPMTEPGTPPAGLMLMAEHGADEKLFAMAAAVEKIVSQHDS